MNITEASDKNVSEICALVNSAYRGDTSRIGWTTEADLLDGIRVDENTLKEYLHETGSTILISSNEKDKITGCVYLKKEGENLYLGMLTVAPPLQTKGIGKILLRAAEKRATELDCTSIVMTVITSRHELIEWYKRHGYHETGLRRPFPKDEKFGIQKLPLEFMVMQKDLK